MENHPIPQDVIGFQFKLIGNMTVKQFAYLAVGIVLAWIFLQLPITFLIKIPLGAFFAILGLGLAFFPISGRPMDLMIGNYIKALFRPTQFIYEKRGQDLYFSSRPVASAKMHKSSFNPLPDDKLKAYLEDKALAPQPTVQPVVQNAYVPPAPQIPTPLPAQAKLPAARFGASTGMPTPPDSPNLITGIVKDPRGNPLPNILIEIRDKENNPVRAFKTNEVGRFASATALMNGAYTIEFEDPKGQNRFQTKTINATGEIIIPIEVMSIDTREELRKSLFSPDASGLNNQ